MRMEGMNVLIFTQRPLFLPSIFWTSTSDDWTALIYIPSLPVPSFSLCQRLKASLSISTFSRSYLFHLLLLFLSPFKTDIFSTFTLWEHFYSFDPWRGRLREGIKGGKELSESVSLGHWTAERWRKEVEDWGKDGNLCPLLQPLLLYILDTMMTIMMTILIHPQLLFLDSWFTFIPLLVTDLKVARKWVEVDISSLFLEGF